MILSSLQQKQVCLYVNSEVMCRKRKLIQVNELTHEFDNHTIEFDPKIIGYK